MMNGWNPYAGASGAPGTSELDRYYLNQDPNAAWWRYLGLLGFTGTNPRQRYAQNQMSRYQGMYASDAASNPNAGFYDWLLGKGGQFNDEIGQASPDQVGDFSYRSLQPKARYVIG